MLFFRQVTVLYILPQVRPDQQKLVALVADFSKTGLTWSEPALPSCRIFKDRLNSVQAGSSRSTIELQCVVAIIIAAVIATTVITTAVITAIIIAAVVVIITTIVIINVIARVVIVAIIACVVIITIIVFTIIARVVLIAMSSKCRLIVVVGVVMAAVAVVDGVGQLPTTAITHVIVATGSKDWLGKDQLGLTLTGLVRLSQASNSREPDPELPRKSWNWNWKSGFNQFRSSSVPHSPEDMDGGDNKEEEKAIKGDRQLANDEEERSCDTQPATMMTVDKEGIAADAAHWRSAKD
ncbi:hypothetical protein EDB89DRAFT_1906349 [Lactarius sanguifluus]|nr:hypothetical protein EDB89DRAFT_1906349 [Lactarius sanguifluus]